MISILRTFEGQDLDGSSFANEGGAHMTSQTDSRHVLRTICVLALSLSVVVGGVADLRRTWQPIGVVGTVANSDAVIVAVDPGSPAASAGIVPGDRFDLSSLSPQQRWWLFPQNCLSPGLRITVGVFHSGQYRRVTLTSVTERMGTAEKAAVWMETVTGVIMVAIGTLVVLLKRSPVAWGFYLYCLATAPLLFSRELDGTLLLPYSDVWIISVLLIYAAGLPGLLIFSLRVLQADLRGWRLYAERAAFVFFAVLAALLVGGVLMNYNLGQPAKWTDDTVGYIKMFLSVVIVFALLDTYVRARGADKPRLRWMIAGIVVTLAFPLYSGYLQNAFPSTPALADWPSIILAVAPIGVAYAIIKHQVIDVRFILSRTLVYGTLTAVLVGVFGVIDWLVGRVLDQTRLAVVVDVCVAIVLGFWLNGLHRMTDRFVDQVLFRRRHDADRRLTRLAAGLPHASSFGMVDEALVREPAEALGLDSAALFRRDATGNFELKASVGWPAGAMKSFGEQDTLLLYLQGAREALRLSDVRWPHAEVLESAHRPALGVPIIVRHQIAAIAFFGQHASGEEFDSGEIRLLESCAIAAGAAYDHLEADELRSKTDEMQRTIDSLRLTLQTYGVPSR
jgi:GAF domain-containing protein